MNKWGQKLSSLLAKQKLFQNKLKKHSPIIKSRIPLKPGISSRVVTAQRLLMAKLGLGTLSMASKASIIIAIALFSAFVPQIVGSESLFKIFGAKASVDTGNIDIWWPTEGAVVRGSQPLKALVKDVEVGAYKMFWQVDSGSFNYMPDSYQDWPHKETIVDYTNWNWRGNGPYVLTFKAVDHGNREIGRKSVTIYVNGKPEQQATSPSSPVKQISAALTSVTSAVLTSASAETPVSATQYQLDVWWPSSNATLSGIQPFKAMLQNQSVSSYKMYWQQGNGQFNEMPDNFTDYPHKEVSVDVSKWGNGQHEIHFVARDSAGQIIGQKAVAVTVIGSQGVAVPSSAAAEPAPVAIPSSVPVQAPAASNSGNPFAGAKLYVNPYNEVKQKANEWRSYRPDDARMLDKIGDQPEVHWMGGWNWDIRADVQKVMSANAAQGSLPVFIAYNIPQRDCGQYSAGGVGSPEAYRQWIRDFAAGLGGKRAVVILEPDGLSLISCLDENGKRTRFELIKDAVSVFKSAGAAVYIDAGHSAWISAQEKADRLKAAGIENADGFALNISNFRTTSESTSYGESVSKLVGGKHFIIDTGRNGLGPSPDSQWCNPSGRALGQKPTTSTGHHLVDAYLWAKGPGGSDGNCNGGPNAGIFWPDYAVDLARRAAW